MESLALLRAVALTCGLSVISGGCSLSLTGADPGRPRNVVPVCDTEKHLVVVDGVLGSIAALTTLIALGNDEGGVGAVAGLTSAAYLLAASRGNSKVNECREAIAAYAPMVDPERAREERRALRGPGRGEPSDGVPRFPVQDPAAVGGGLEPVPPPVPPPVVAPPAGPPVAASPPTPSPRPASPDEWRDFWREAP